MCPQRLPGAGNVTRKGRDGVALDRCALFVDANYALADGALAVHGTRNRDSVSWDYAGLLKLLGGLSRDRTGLQLLRCYWYDTSADGNRSADHDVLADIPGVKLRLSKIRPNRKEGVEAEIRKDLSALARNHAISDVIIVSAEEDLAPVIAEVQDLGLRAILLHIVPPDGGWEVSRPLRQECDDLIEISSGHLRPYVDLVAGAEPQLAAAAYRELPATAVSSSHPAIEAPAQRLYGSPVAEYQAALQAQIASLAASAGGERRQDAARFGPVSTASAGIGGAVNVGAVNVGAANVGAANVAGANGGGANGRAAHTGPGGTDSGARDADFSAPQAAAMPEQFAQPVVDRERDFAGNSYPAGGHDRQEAPGGPVFGHQSLPDDSRGYHHTQSGSAPAESQVSAQAQRGQPGQGGVGEQAYFSGQDAFAGQNPPSAYDNGVSGQNGQSGLGSIAAEGVGTGGHYASGLRQAGVPSNGHGRMAASGPLNGAVPGGGMPANGFPGTDAFPGTGAPSIDRAGNGGGQFGSVPPAGGAPYGSGRPDTGRAEASRQGSGRPDDGPDDRRFGGGQPRDGLAGNGPVNGGSGGSGLPSNAVESRAGASRGGPAHGMPANGGPGNGVPGSSLPGNSLPSNGLPGNAAISNAASGNGSVGSGVNGVAGNGQHGGQDLGSLPGYLPAGQNLPGQNLPAHGQFANPRAQAAPNGLAPNGLGQNGLGQGQEQRGQRQLPAGGQQYSMDRGEAPYGGQLQPAQYGVPANGTYSPYGAQPPAPPPAALSVGDAVQSAHAEGVGFGEAVARDAPALWLEAVLARKPRMPSDLEARLLQGSALPIDSLLHDEVRHALRRGFWDALERSRH